MQSPPNPRRRRAARWLAPAGVLCVAALAATGLLRATAESEELPRTTPTALIAAVQRTDVAGFSGTVVSHFSLGLPELPPLPSIGEEASFNSLLSGSHTMQVWFEGFEKQRIALLGATSETDLFRNGRDLWQWSSSDHVALHVRLPARAHQHLFPLPTEAPSITPLALARRVLAAIDPTTHVQVVHDHAVADRSAYELVLTPREPATKIGSVRISIDGATKIPLGVQVYPRNSDSAAIDVAFTSIHFGAQADRNFEFTPPPNAKVRHITPAHPAAAPAKAKHPRPAPDKTGSGWTTVFHVAPGKRALADFTKSVLGKQLATVSGSWGKGRLLDSALVSMLVTDDGHIYAGAVVPAQLFAAAATK